MESLLSIAFDNLSSYDGPKVKKGLKQIEGLLAPICLSKPKSPPKKPTDSEGQSDVQQPQRKTMGQLQDDPAFLEFFKLQEGFQWNIAHKLLETLDRLMARGSEGQNDLLIVSTLDLIQGILMLHPPSKILFARKRHMDMLLDLLEPCNCPAIHSATLITLVVAFIDTPQNTRIFESLDGLLSITSLFKTRSTPRDVKLKLVEFLYFYLMPETPSIPRAEARDSVPAMLQRSPSKLAKAFTSARRRAESIGDSEGTRSTEEKQALLGRHLQNVEDLVRDLTTTTPFGGVVC